LLDAATGDVLALVSSPGFDPTAFSTGLTPAMWQELSTDPRNPLTDKAIGGVYPPGSTFKPVVALAALEAGIITPETAVSCPGYLELGDATFHCWRHGGHGTLHVRDAIKKSCDVFFYETARRTGIDRIAEMARRLGFGAPLGLDIPGERGGLMPTREWKLATTGTPWQQGETLIAGIGQGSVLATPLQLATMAARLVTGRAVVPHLLRPEGRLPPGGDLNPPAFAPLSLAPRNLGLVLDGMTAVVNEQGGTAYAARITEPGLAMGGKSGTSQVRRITQYEREHGLRKVSEIPWKERDHALFVAFAPVGAPRYVCSVVVEHGGESGGGGSAVGAPICRDVLVEAQRRDPARQVPKPESIARTLAPQLPVTPVSVTAPEPRRG
jgi:penicillin-binding protein 2